MSPAVLPRRKFRELFRLAVRQLYTTAKRGGVARQFTTLPSPKQDPLKPYSNQHKLGSMTRTRATELEREPQSQSESQRGPVSETGTSG